MVRMTKATRMVKIRKRSAMAVDSCGRDGGERCRRLGPGGGGFIEICFCFGVEICLDLLSLKNLTNFNNAW
jgi:hypothetical protein